MILDIEQQRVKKGETKPKEKNKPPQKYQAVYHQPPGVMIPCAVCLVRDAFDISARKA